MTCMKVIADPFDYDMRNLGNTRSVADGAGALYQRVGAIFPLDITPVATVVLPDLRLAPAFRKSLLERDCADAEMRKRLGVVDKDVVAAECRRRVAAGEPTQGVIEDVKSILGVLPPDQELKWPVVQEILKLLDDPAVKELDAEQKKQLDEWAPPRDLRPVQPNDVPQLLSLLFRERDGSIGRVVRIFPVPGQFEGWDGRELMRMQDILHDIPMPDGSKLDAAGWTNVFADMMRWLAADGPRAALYALLGVALLVVVSFGRPRAILLVLGALVMGVIWMTGAAARLGIRFNFLNFVAVPVTLGIGVDYAVNVYARLRREPREAWAKALAETGSAVALCSLTTIIGYSSLLKADNGALRSLGKVANLGELSCLVAALLVVPSVMALGARRGKPTAAAADVDVDAA
jgi:hypothetical protein